MVCRLFDIKLLFEQLHAICLMERTEHTSMKVVSTLIYFHKYNVPGNFGKTAAIFFR